jgi:hypothetical protein
MIRPEPQLLKSLAAVCRQYPDVLDWLRDWQMQELHRLPSVLNHTAVAQGRCQVLSEIVDLISEAPAMAAKL